MTITMWQTTQLDEAIAEEFFGWGWQSFVGVPNRSHHGYPEHTRVRQFMSPQVVSKPQWQEYLDKQEGKPADGTEPLAYCYDSSMGPESVPHFSGHHSAIADLEREIRKRGLWGQYRAQLWAQICQCDTDATDIDEERLADANCEKRCIASLAVVGSKYVVPETGARAVNQVSQCQK